MPKSVCGKKKKKINDQYEGTSGAFAFRITLLLQTKTLTQMQPQLRPISPQENEQQQFQQTTGKQQDSLLKQHVVKVYHLHPTKVFTDSNQTLELLVMENPKPFLPCDVLSHTPLFSSNCLRAITAPISKIHSA